MKILTFLISISILTLYPKNLNIGKSEIKFENLIEVIEEESTSEYDIYVSIADSVLVDYKTEMNGKMMADAWIKTKEKFGVDVPVTLSLAQAKMESKYCTSSLAKSKNNPYSLKGSKTYKTYNSLEEGIIGYYELMAKNYLACKTLDELLINFVNCNGHRYAGSVNYEYNLKKEIKIIEDKIK
jgi:hypothetical protein